MARGCPARNTAWRRVAALALWVAPAFMGGDARAEVAPEFVQIGARARGMGSAFTAVAAGVDALAWNPAGLTQLTEPELKGDLRLNFGSGEILEGIQNFDSGAGGIVPVENFTDTPGSNFSYSMVGGAAPLPLKGRAEPYGLAGALAYRRVIDLLFRQEQLLLFDPGAGFTIPFEHVDDSRGGPDAFTFALAGKPHSRVALGFNVNFLTGFVEDLDQQQVSFSGQQFFVNEIETRSTFGGTMFELGALVDVTKKISVGGMIRPGFDIDQEGGSGHIRVFAAEGGPTPASDTLITFKTNDLTLGLPMFYSLGARGTPLPGLLVAADWQYKPWNELTVVQHTPTGDVEPENTLYPAHTFHLGGEYMLNRTGDVQVPIRLGFHTAPTSGANVDSLSADVNAEGFRNFRGDRVEGNAWSGGVGLYFPTVQFDISVDRTSYEYSEFLFNQVPPPGQPLSVVEIKETLTNLYFSSTIRF
jgi:hypothetical protein